MNEAEEEQALHVYIYEHRVALAAAYEVDVEYGLNARVFRDSANDVYDVRMAGPWRTPKHLGRTIAEARAEVERLVGGAPEPAALYVVEVQNAGPGRWYRTDRHYGTNALAKTAILTGDEANEVSIRRYPHAKVDASASWGLQWA